MMEGFIKILYATKQSNKDNGNDGKYPAEESIPIYRDWMLLSIVFLGLGLRILGIWYSWPYVDSFRIVLPVNKLDSSISHGDFSLESLSPGHFVNPTLFIHLVLLGKWLTCHLVNTDLLARMINLILGTTAIFLIYYAGREIFHRAVGLISALFLATNPLHMTHSQYPMTEPLLFVLVTATILWLFRYYNASIVKENKRLSLSQTSIVLGIIIGAAMGTKFSGLYLLGYWFFVLVLRKIQRLPAGGLYAWMTPLIVVLSFILTTPSFLWEHKQFQETMAFLHYAIVTGQLGFSQLGTWDFFFGQTPSWFESRLLINSLSGMMGREVVCLSIVSHLILLLIGCYLFLRRFVFRIADECHSCPAFWLFQLSMVVVVVGMTILLTGQGRVRAARYMLPVLPILFLLNAHFLYSLVSWVFRHHIVNPRRDFLLSLMCTFILIGSPFFTCLRQGYLISHRDTREISLEWIEKNLPPFSTVINLGAIYNPPLPSPRFQKIVPTHGQYNLAEIERSMVPTLEESENFSYCIVNEFYLEIVTNEEAMFFCPTFAQRWRRFFFLIANQWSLLAVFPGNTWDKPGPTIWVFRVEPGYAAYINAIFKTPTHPLHAKCKKLIENPSGFFTWFQKMVEERHKAK